MRQPNKNFDKPAAMEKFYLAKSGVSLEVIDNRTGEILTDVIRSSHDMTANWRRSKKGTIIYLYK